MPSSRGVMILYTAELQRSNAGLDCLPIAHDHHDQLVLLNVPVGRPFCLVGGHGADALSVGDEKVTREIWHEGRCERRRHAARRLEAARELERDVVLRLVELILRNRLMNPVELFEKLAQGIDGLVDLNAGRRAERSWSESHLEVRARAVSVAMHLAQIRIKRDVKTPPYTVFSTLTAK